MIWINLALILALPLSLGLLTRQFYPAAAEKLRRPLGRFAVIALFGFVIVALIRDRQMFSWQETLYSKMIIKPPLKS